jgi:hypothetical protein
MRAAIHLASSEQRSQQWKEEILLVGSGPLCGKLTNKGCSSTIKMGKFGFFSNLQIGSLSGVEKIS